jgi:hypothetical protein
MKMSYKADFKVNETIYQVFIEGSLILIGCDMHRQPPKNWAAIGNGRGGKAIKDAALIALVNNINPSLFQVHYYD